MILRAQTNIFYCFSVRLIGYRIIWIVQILVIRYAVNSFGATCSCSIAVKRFFLCVLLNTIQHAVCS